MRNISRRAMWAVFVCTVLIGSYLVLKSVIASTRVQNPQQVTMKGMSGIPTQPALELERQSAQNINSKDMFTQTLAHIKAAREARDINELERVGDAIELNWDKLDASSYASLMLEVCNALSSTNLSGDNQYNLEQKYASLTLSKQLQIPADLEAQLVLHLQEDIEYVKGQLNKEEWQEKRLNKAELWLRTWHHLNMAIDPNFDFKDLPLESVPLPPGVAGTAGMSPDMIQDPNLRAQYQSAIEANRRKAENFRTQSALYKMREIFRERMKSYLIRAYSRPPEKTKELEEVLRKYFVDENMLTSLLNAVKTGTGVQQ